MNERTILCMLAAAIIPVPAAYAQQTLKKEIVVEREIEPAERAANRLASVTPSIFTPRTEIHTLSMGEYNGRGEVRRQLTILEPAGWRDTLEVSPYRGYLAGGYFPLFNAGISAGYRLIDKHNTTLDAWLQYDGYSYKMDAACAGLATGVGDDDKVSLNKHQVGVGLNLSGDLRYGKVDGSVGIMGATYSMPLVERGFDQSAFGASIAAGWTAATKTFPWHAGLSMKYFGYGKAENLPAPETRKDRSAMNELDFDINAGISRSWSGGSAVGLEARMQLLGHNGSGYFTPMTQAAPGFAEYHYGDGKTAMLVTLTPAYSFVGEYFNLHLGANVDFASKAGSNGIYVTPEVSAAWTPSGIFAAWAKVSGGKHLNSIAEAYEYSPYQFEGLTYDAARIPVDASAGVTIGPVSGLSFAAWLGYSRARNWLMISQICTLPMMYGTDIKGIRYGARIGWNFRDIVDIHISGEGAPNSLERGYYRWRDHARWVVDAGIMVHPVSKLDIGVTWQLRSGRNAIVYGTGMISGSGLIPAWEMTKESLGDSNSLDLHAAYRITDAFTVFGDFENLLCRRWMIMPQVCSQKLHGLVGVAYKF